MGTGSIGPFILYPRRTAILTSEPLLKWYDTGARSYTVQIFSDGNVIWQEENVLQNQIRYSGNPQLKTQKKYRLKVIDNDTDNSSDNEPMKGLGFQLVDNKAIKIIEEQKLKIQAMDLSKNSKNLAIALYYASQRFGDLTLCGETLTLLDDISRELATPAIHLWRGHMYGEMRLSNEAEKAYLKALELAKTTGELYIQAEANSGLWCVTKKQAYKDDAIKLYSQLGEEPRFVCEIGLTQH